MTEQDQQAPALRRFAVIDEAGALINITLWDGVTEWHPGPGLSAVPEAQWQAAPNTDPPPADPPPADPA